MTYDAIDRAAGGAALREAVGRIDFELIRPVDEHCYDDSLALAIGLITNTILEAFSSEHTEMMLDAYADLGRWIYAALYGDDPRPELMTSIARIYGELVAGHEDGA